MRRTLVSALAAALLVAGVSFARPEGSLEATFFPVSTQQFGGTAITQGNVDTSPDIFLGVFNSIQVSTTETNWGVTASDTRHVTIRKFICFVSSSVAGTGSVDFNLIVAHVDATDIETIGSVRYNLATQLATFREDTTFTTPTLTPPYFIGVRIDDDAAGGATLGAALNAQCSVMWSW